MTLEARSIHRTRVELDAEDEPELHELCTRGSSLLYHLDCSSLHSHGGTDGDPEMSGIAVQFSESQIA